MVINAKASGPHRCLVLVSGGIESTTLLYQLVRKGETVTPVYLSYGQRPAAQELRAARAQGALLGLEVETLDIAAAAKTFQAGQERQFHIPLPHRNLVALSLGLSLAEKREASRLLVGITGEDAEVAPSAAPPFMDAFRHMAGLLGSVDVDAPFQALRKAEVIELGAQLGVDFGKTYSCLLGYPEPCGRCPQCNKRGAAFNDAGITEPPFNLMGPEE